MLFDRTKKQTTLLSVVTQRLWRGVLLSFCNFHILLTYQNTQITMYSSWFKIKDFYWSLGYILPCEKCNIYSSSKYFSNTQIYLCLGEMNNFTLILSIKMSLPKLGNGLSLKQWNKRLIKIQAVNVTIEFN